MSLLYLRPNHPTGCRAILAAPLIWSFEIWIFGVLGTTLCMSLATKGHKSIGLYFSFETGSGEEGEHASTWSNTNWARIGASSN